MIYFYILCYLILLRIAELILAKSNERHQKLKGGIEINDPYYKYIVITHVLFFVSLIIESLLIHQWNRPVTLFLLILFVFLQGFRFWCILSLGRFWNTKVIILPNAQLIVNGPYRWLNHPNYWVVGLEFILIPIIFKAYFTAVIFTLLHIWLMSKRIPLENRALNQYLTE